MAMKNLKMILWSSVFPKLLTEAMEIKAKKRKEKICRCLSDNLQKGLEVK